MLRPRDEAASSKRFSWRNTNPRLKCASAKLGESSTAFEKSCAAASRSPARIAAVPSRKAFSNGEDCAPAKAASNTKRQDRHGRVHFEAVMVPQTKSARPIK